MNVVSTGIYFIQEGKVEVFSRENDIPMLLYDSGSYIGDTSFIFKIRNHYGYYYKTESNENQVYSL